MITLRANPNFYRYLSLHVWGALPAILQRAISAWYARIYEHPLSRHIIAPYCKAHYKDERYLQQFEPASGKEGYRTFQDFFTRRYKRPVQASNSFVWGSEGLFCEYGKLDELPLVHVKGDKRHPRAIFGAAASEIPAHYYFANIFLHNNNYHRIHAPVSGTIRRIEHIPGELVVLRPWIYPQDPSQPALRNERCNVDIEDGQGRIWYLSIVGGPAVGTIVMNPLHIGAKVAAADEIGTFLLGSTCCYASPEPVTNAQVGQTVFVGEDW